MSIVYYLSAYLGPELSWLERAPDKGEVDGSSPFGPTKYDKNPIRLGFNNLKPL